MKLGAPVLVLVLAFLATASVPAWSQDVTARTTTIRIWGGTAPGSESAPQTENYDVYNEQGDRVYWNIARPVLIAHYAAKPTGAAILLIPGGGYRALYVDALVPVARWFNSLGIDAFILKHRLPDEGHKAGESVPLQDAQRSLRLIRSGAFSGGHSIDSNRIGVMGLSAGGNLAAVLGMYHAAKVYEPIDRADLLSARPDFMILAYAVLPQNDEITDHPQQRNVVRLYRKYGFGGAVTAGAPPAFLMHGDADRDVPYTESERFARVLRAHGVAAELHIFHGTGHSFVINGKGEERVWPELCAQWLRARGILVPGG